MQPSTTNDSSWQAQHKQKKKRDKIQKERPYMYKAQMATLPLLPPIHINCHWLSTGIYNYYTSFDEFAQKYLASFSGLIQCNKPHTTTDMVQWKKERTTGMHGCPKICRCGIPHRASHQLAHDHVHSDPGQDTRQSSPGGPRPPPCRTLRSKGSSIQCPTLQNHQETSVSCCKFQTAHSYLLEIGERLEEFIWLCNQSKPTVVPLKNKR